MHGYIMKNLRSRKASNHAAWRAKTGQIRLEDPSIDELPQGRTYPGIDNVEDLGDGSTNDGGPPDVVVDPRDAALEDEKNLGPNAPGYIP